ncbi:tubulin epsilon and delta complex protein 1-like [Asterias amurensis]|uniref:tubulin epsilon and delta complex protein 1-like n=1 Tax=Asterias amurensis TaxID=7602 RepID=UPI003AB40744
MMASSRSSAGRPRDAIGSLCQLLNLKGITGLTPEIFRQAKFNKPEAVAPLWSLLYSLAHYNTHKCIPSKTDAARHTRPTHRISSTKHAMWAEGYRCNKLYRLPDDMSGGSREVLLACAWLLAKTDILADIILDDRAMAVADTAHLHLEEVVKAMTRMKGASNSISGDLLPSDCAKRLGWMVGRCRMAMRRLYVQQQEFCSLTHQIHVATQGLSVSMDTSHLSPFETFITRHSDQLKTHHDFLEAEQSRLHICIRWQEQQQTFWQWMESVLDAKLQDSQVDLEEEEADDSTKPNSSPRSGDLMEMLIDLEGCTQQLERLVDDDGSSEDARYTSKLSLIAEDVRSRLAPPPTATSTRRHSHQTTRFHLTSKQSKAPSAAQNEPVNRIHIQDEITRLSAVVEQLKVELEDLREGHRCRIEDLTSVLPDAVCIPPMGSSR